MTPGLVWSRLDLGLRSLTPGLITLLLALLPALPVRLPGEWVVMPALTLMSVYYWTIYRPDLLPLPAIFAIGVLEDLVTGGPLGLTALKLLGTWALVVAQRRLFLGRPFGIAWAGFLLVTFCATLVSWLLTSLLALHPVPAREALLHLTATVMLFPLLVWFFIRTHRKVLPRV